MDKDSPADGPVIDSQEMNRALARIAERSRRAVADFLDRQSRDTTLANFFDPLHVGDAFLQMTAQILASPARLVEAQFSLWSNYLQLWQHTARTMLGDAPEASAAAEDWSQAELFDFIKQSYLLTARWIQSLLRADKNGSAPLGQADAQMVDFYTRQFIDAMTPAGFFAANPDVLEAVVASGGDSLVRGLDHLLAELERGKRRLAGADEASPRRATSAGKSVFRNRSIELLQYAPSTGKVHKTPLLIVPPWNARHHLVDLEPTASLVKWAVERCHTVFILSWAPPEGDLAKRDFADTLQEGPLAALEAIERITGERRVNGLGFGLGGTLLAATLGTLAARGEDRFASATYLCALVDFFEAGELSVFTNEETIRVLDLKRTKKPQADSRTLSATVDLLRANDIIWSFVVDCLLDAATPLPFEALRWNSDSLSLATAMQDFYLRAIYQRNLLAEPGGISMQGTPIDLGGITAPSYVMAGREDRLSPWRTSFAATRLFSGPVTFVLAPSGHAGSIVNPPGERSRGYWTNARRVKDPEAWLRNATRQSGSWWEDWARWLAPLSGPMVAARKPGA
jgi:polyhydroxyalkanoate synthase